ncbi:protein translocase subunit SecD [Nocardioides sp.]|uniref:protein translocase subunit SecD n=1 Tax=Nocardioides sp. TaxID=35761 RepID=UPI003515D303
MAARRPRPGRNLVVFFLGIGVLFGLVGLAGSWKPTLGLDLQGGTRIILTAADSPSSENLEEARRIIDQRVNGSGIAEAAVTTQGNRNIIVEVPGDKTDRDQLEETVKRTAQLRFRLVACSDVAPGPCAQQAPGGALPGGVAPGGAAPGGLNRPGLDLSQTGTAPAPTPAATPSGAASASSSDPSGAASDTASPSSSSSAPAEGPSSSNYFSADEAITWSAAPDAESVAEFAKYTCSPTGELLNAADGQPAAIDDNPNKPLVACSTPDRQNSAYKFLMSRAIIEGTELDGASARPNDQGVGWQVTIDMGDSKAKASPRGTPGAATDFETVSRAFSGSDRQFAIVLDGVVISYPRFTATITDGRSSITGDFSETQAIDLANSLKFGALPIKFDDKNTSVEEIGPSLAGNQLQAGLAAGAIGLLAVMIACLLYYRGLGMVVVSSLFVAAAITYALVLLLSETAGFTLTLPGIAGLIIAVGVTADSFIIFFERIRDEMREGKSMRVAVETGWARARVTRVAANTVQLLSAAVLYIFATGAVKGFGFALGLTTLIDLAVLFWFTKPAVSWLAQFKFFNSGHRLSGLSKETLGMDAPAARPVTAGGKA